MKTTKLISIVLAAGLAGAALAQIGLSPLLGYVPGTQLFAIAAAAGLAFLALADVSRQIDPLRPQSRIARPALDALTPAWHASAPAPAQETRRRAA
ncbi:MAG TPA: hypothetical protein VGM73_06725 [Candidatus Didemnitutus sp.]|jgi:hypothetical protein